MLFAKTTAEWWYRGAGDVPDVTTRPHELSLISKRSKSFSMRFLKNNKGFTSLKKVFLRNDTPKTTGTLLIPENKSKKLPIITTKNIKQISPCNK